MLRLAETLLAELFPFHIGFDRHLRVIRTGRSVGRILPGLSVGDLLSDRVEPATPDVVMNFDALAAQSRSLMLLRIHEAGPMAGMVLRGQVVPCEGGTAVFVGSPWLSDVGTLQRLGLSLDDFAPHDPMVDILQVMQHTTAGLEDVRQLNNSLRRQRAELSAANAMLAEQNAALLRTQDELDRKGQEASRLALVAARTHDAVVLTDPSGAIEWVNEGFTRLTGYSLSEVQGRTPGSVLQGPETCRETVARIRTQLADQQGVTAELLNYRKSGEPYWVAIEIQPIHEHGVLTGYMAVERDVTERRDAERQVKASAERLAEALQRAELASRYKSEFLANMSHEIRTPMTAIIGYSQMMLRPGRRPADYPEMAGQVLHNADHLLTILNDILDLSKIEAGKLTVEGRRVAPRAVVEQVRSLMAPRAADKGLTFDLVYDPGVPATVRTDPVRLRQVLLNLASNAVKFTHRGGVTVRVSVRDCGRLAFQVTDTGIGIAPEHLDQIFTPFEQLGSSRNYGGTGLGLDIARRLATMLGGEIHVESDIGRGSSFTLLLPGTLSDPRGEPDTDPLAGVESIALPDSLPFLQTGTGRPVGHLPSPVTAAPSPLPVDASVAQGSRWSNSPAATSPLQGRRLLIVDDSADNRRIVRFLLEEAGATVTTADCGAEAVSLVRSTEPPFDVVLMDLQMPGMDGLTATRTLRAAGSKVPVIALTARTMAGDAERCRAAGCVAHIGKPVVPHDLYTAVALAAPPRLHVTPTATPSAPSAPAPTTAPDLCRCPPWLVKAFREGLATASADLLTAIDRADVDRLKLISHRLAGSAGMYGYPTLSRLARTCDEAARAARPPTEVTAAALALNDAIVLALSTAHPDPNVDPPHPTTAPTPHARPL